MDSWPNQLRQMVLLVMTDPNPAVVCWGKEQGWVYNEAYVPLVGQKHPHLHGKNPRFGGLGEVWDHFDQVLQECEQTGKPHMAARSIVLLNRYGYLEETYFSYKFVPIIGEDGFVLGSHVSVVENTREVINDRRMLCVQNMSSKLADAKDLSQFWPIFLKSLEMNDTDVPLALVYSVKAGDRCTLEGSFGVAPNPPGLPSDLHLGQSDHHFATLLQKAMESPSPLLVKTGGGTFPEELFQGIDWKGFGVPSNEYVMCQIRAGGLIAVLILALNPRRPWDLDFQRFIGLITEQLVSPHVHNLALAADVAARKAKAEQALRDQAGLFRAQTREFEESMKFTRFADRAPVGLCVTDISGKILYTNRAWTEFTGVDPASSEGLGWMDGTVEEDKPKLHEWWHRLTQGESGSFQIKTKQPFEAVSKSGALMKADHRTGICAAYTDFGNDHKITTVMGVIVDISEQVWIQDQIRQRTAELEQSELKYRRFAEHAPVGVCRFDKNGLIDFSNNAWTTIFEQQQNNENGVPWIESVHPADLNAFKVFLSDIRTLRAPKPIECRLKRRYVAFNHAGPDQPFAWVLASGHAELSAHGIVEGVVCSVTEISAQKAAVRVLTNEVEEAMRLKRQQENFIDVGVLPFSEFLILTIITDDQSRNSKSSQRSFALRRRDLTIFESITKNFRQLYGRAGQKSA